MERSKHLTKFVGLSALLVAGSAAFFSVFVLSNLFAGAKISVVVMAGSLEFGKLVAASFLYRFWDNINRLLKIYWVTGVIILVGITSAGIFGYLSNAYQGATVNFEKQSTELLALEDRLDVLLADESVEIIGDLEFENKFGESDPFGGPDANAQLVYVNVRTRSKIEKSSDKKDNITQEEFRI